MCFSEEASFTAAVAVSVVAGATIQMAGLSRLTLLALTPLLFALQQFSEGLTWLHLKQVLEEGPLTRVAYNYYLLISLAGWPIWIPLSLLIAEREKTSKTILFCFLVGGFLVASYNLFAIFNGPVSAVAVGHSIRYEVNIPYNEVWIYAIFTLLPWFFSSLKSAWLTGLVFIFSFIVAGFFYEFTFVSIWCFYAAVVSALVYKVVADNTYGIKPA